jgi:RNA polymerase sigma-70 factor (ECF subfamily)
VADDLTQEFALQFLRGQFRDSHPDRGRFRDFVVKALHHMIVDHRRRRAAEPGPLPAYDAALAVIEKRGTAEEEFLRHWREELLGRTWKALAVLEEQTGQLSYTVLRWRVEDKGVPAARLAAELTVRQRLLFTEAAVPQALHRAREPFAELLRREVARSLETADARRVREESSELGLLPYLPPR